MQHKHSSVQGAPSSDSALPPVHPNRGLATGLALLAAGFGVLGLLGWTLGVSALKSVLPGAVEMKANTALGLVVTGGALAVLGSSASPRAKQLASLAALVVGSLGLVTLAEYAFGWTSGIDEILYRDTATAFNAARGRMSPYSAASFAILGASLPLLGRPRLRPVVWSATILTLGTASVSVLGYLWNATEIVTDDWVPPVALNTALAFASVGAALVLVLRASTREGATVGTTSGVEKRFLLGFVAALVLLTGTGGSNYERGTALVDTARWVSHTHEVRAALHRLAGQLSETKAEQRTYLLTRDARHAENHAKGRSKTELYLAELAVLVADSPTQTKSAADLEIAMRRALDRLDFEVAYSDREGLDALRGLVTKDDGAGDLADIFLRIDAMDAAEHHLLDAREVDLLDARRTALVSLLLTFGVATAGFFFLYRGIRRELVARAQAEQASREAREHAELANRAKSTFLATMSHEIRTPMNGLLGMIELLDLTPLDGEQRATVSIARESGVSLLRIIDDVLDIAKIEAGKLDLRPEVASVRAVVEQVHALYRGTASSKGLALTYRTDPAISPAVTVDPMRLRQILSNLVSNALKFTPRGGSIELSVELLERHDDQDHLRFAVTDTGVGISPEAKERLFRPFVQADGETTRRYGGTGLGLTICRRLAEMMGGTVEMSSLLGEGTTVSLTLALPIADSHDLPAPASVAADELRATLASHVRTAPSVKQAEAEGTLVLIVDDHPVNRVVLTRQLGTLGYAALSANDGVAALALWQARRFGAVVTDCHMPEMDGYELARRVRALEAEQGAKRTPIIACTANALSGESALCLAAGMDDYLPKPVELGAMRKALERWLPLPDATVDTPKPPLVDAVALPAADAPLHQPTLDELYGDDHATQAEVLDEFRRAMVLDLAELKAAVEAKDQAGVRRVSHRVKGACGLVGALPMRARCERFEHASTTADWTALSEELPNLTRDWDKLAAAIARVLQTKSLIAATSSAVSAEGSEGERT